MSSLGLGTRQLGVGIGTVITIVAGACGGLLWLLVAHASEPKHAEAAHETDVHRMAVRLERVAADVDNNKTVLIEVKSDVSALRVEQRESTQEILRAINGGG